MSVPGERFRRPITSSRATVLETTHLAPIVPESAASPPSPPPGAAGSEPVASPVGNELSREAAAGIAAGAPQVFARLRHRQGMFN
jgi:hypothetical protein